MFISASAYLRYDGCPHNNDYRLIINNAWLFQMPLIIALFYITRRARTIIGVRGRARWRAGRGAGGRGRRDPERRKAAAADGM